MIPTLPPGTPTEGTVDSSEPAASEAPTEGTVAIPAPEAPLAATPDPGLPVVLPANTPPTPDPRQAAIAAVESANERLRLAIEQPTDYRLAALEQYWRDAALPKAQGFARAMYYRVGKPVRAAYVYLIPPTIVHEPALDRVLVDAIEVWTYEGGILVYTEHFMFYYTLMQQEGEWVIVDYTYRNAPTPAPPRYG
jgi:hypothetical protein